MNARSVHLLAERAPPLGSLADLVYWLCSPALSKARVREVPSQPQNAKPELPRLIFYAALSKASGDSDQESIESQIARVRAKAEAEYPAGYTLLRDGAREFFADDGYSGSKRDRGPALERAIRAAVDAANNGSAPVELWVNTAARFARGDGTKDRARSLLELYAQMKRAGVRLRAAHPSDDEMLGREELIGMLSRMSAKYAEDLSESVNRAKQRALAAGEHLGGPLADGYRMLRRHDAEGRVIEREPEFDPNREPQMRELLRMIGEGLKDLEIAQRANTRGYRTQRGNLYDAKAIGNIATNPYYAGLIAHKRNTPEMRIYPGRHPRMIEPEQYFANMAARALRDLTPGSDKSPAGGRPPENHAIARLARCRCGQPMRAKTSTHVRKDGTRRRTYTCNAALLRTGTCDVEPFDAEIVDAAVIEGLDGLLVDFDAWRAQLTSGHAAERERIAHEVQRAERDHDAQASQMAKVEAKWTAYIAADDDARADAVLPMVEREREALVQSERRLTAARDALASVPTEAPTDAMLDFANALREAIRGRVDPSASLVKVNQALRSLFTAFELTPTQWAGEQDGRPAFDGGPAVRIKPFLSWETAERLARAGTTPSGRGTWPKLVRLGEPEGDAPPLHWLLANPNPETTADDPVGNPEGRGDPWDVSSIDAPNVPRAAARAGDYRCDMAESPDTAPPVRIDKWLWAARLAKTRPLAAEAVRGGHVEVNGRRVPPGRRVAVGDRVEATIGGVKRVVVVRGTAERRGPASVAATLYEETPESVAERERLAEQRRIERAIGDGLPGGPGGGPRPTKRDRRRLDAGGSTPSPTAGRGRRTRRGRR